MDKNRRNNKKFNNNIVDIHFRAGDGSFILNKNNIDQLEKLILSIDPK